MKRTLSIDIRGTNTAIKDRMWLQRLELIYFFAFNLLVLGLSPVMAAQRKIQVSQSSELKSDISGFAELQGDYNKLRFIQYLNSTYPNFISHTAVYDVPIFDVLDDAEGFLKMHPEVAAAWNTKSLLTIRSDVMTEVKTIQTSIKPEAIRDFRSALQSQWLQPESLLGRLNELLNVPMATRSEVAMNLLLQAVPAEQRKLWPKKDPIQQIHFLKKYISANAFAQVDFTRIGLPPPDSSEHFFQALTAAIDAESKITPLAILGGMKAHGIEVTSKIKSFQESDFDFFNEKSWMINFVNSLPDTKARKILRAWVDKSMARYIGTFLSQTDKKEVVISGGIILEEAHPLVALFRGFMAGDCSTMYSALYALSPNERTFLIRDSEGIYRGAVSMTKTLVNGKDNLYVHTLSGPKISAAHAEIILQTIYDQREQLGAKSVTVAQAERLFGLNNFVAPREVLKKWATQGQQVEQTYPDSELRTKLDRIHSQATYDNADRNKLARLYAPNEGTFILRTTLQKKRAQIMTPAQPSRNESYLLALEQYFLNRVETTFRVSQIMKFKITDEFIEQLNNPAKLPVAEWKAHIRRLLSKQKINIDESTLLTRPFIFGRGLLSSSDAFADANREQSVELIVTLLKQFDIMEDYDFQTSAKESLEFSRFTFLGHIVNQNAKMLNTNPIFHKYFRSLVSSEMNETEMIADLVDAGISIEIVADKIQENLIRLMKLSKEHGADSEEVELLRSHLKDLDTHTLVERIIGLLRTGLSYIESIEIAGQFQELEIVMPLHEQALVLATTKEQVLEILRYIVENPSEDYKQQLIRVTLRHQKKLLKLGIRGSDLSNLGEDAVALFNIKLSLTRSRSVLGYFNAIGNLQSANDGTIEIYSDIINSSAEDFFRYKPSFNDGLRLLKKLFFPSSFDVYLSRILGLAKTADDWLKVTELVPNPNAEYNDILNRALLSGFSRFTRMNPNEAQLLKLYQNKNIWKPLGQKILNLAIPKMKSIQQFYQFADFQANPPNTYSETEYGYINYSEYYVLQSFIDNIETFDSLVKTEKDMEELGKKMAPYFTDVLRVFREAKDPKTTAARILVLMSWNNRSPLQYLAERGRIQGKIGWGNMTAAYYRTADMLLPHFLKCNPTPLEVREFLGSFDNEKKREELFDKAAQRAKTQKELDALFQPSRRLPEINYFRSLYYAVNWDRLARQPFSRVFECRDVLRVR